MTITILMSWNVTHPAFAARRMGYEDLPKDVVKLRGGAVQREANPTD
jgi:hypothetical protein